MLKSMRFVLLVTLLMFTSLINAQVTTASMSGKISAHNEPVIGATVLAIHEPTGTRYGAITNVDGRFSLQSMRVGGPYKVEVSYVGYQNAVYKDIYLKLGENYVLNVSLNESSELLDEVVVIGSSSSNMKSDRAGAITNVNREQMATIPTVSRSMNDIMRLSPQSSSMGNGYAVGGGNYRQSYVTVDGAAFNNAFGIGQNLPASGSPISLDALEQISVSVTPYDVRQSGFIGGSINAVTRSGDNQFKATAYTYLTNQNLKGNKVDNNRLDRLESQYYTYGASIGGPILKDKLFFFVNGEYEDNVTAGPLNVARGSSSEAWGKNNINRPVESDMRMMSDYLNSKYGYNPGRYGNYSVNTPSYRIMARLDWNINNDHKLNFRFSRTHTKDSNAPSSSTTPLTDGTIYPGGTSPQGDVIPSGKNNAGRLSNYALYFESSRYYQIRDFTSIATELNSRFKEGKLNNLLRFTYSYQNEPREIEGGFFPTVDILKDGAVYTSFGPDPFTYGNTRLVKTFVITDEINYNAGLHNLTGGFQYERNHVVNGFMPSGAGYYVYNSWEDFVENKQPNAFAITHPNTAGFVDNKPTFDYQQFSLYFQDEITVSTNFKISAGIRLEVPNYPSLKNNYNAAFARLSFGGKKYSTSTMPKTTLNYSPRFGFNWDLTGERKYVLRGGTGVFTGRIPFVWIVSAVGNSNVGQISYSYNKLTDANVKNMNFHNSLDGILNQLYGGNFEPISDPSAPTQPTIMQSDLKMPSTWKTSLAFDAKLPGDIDFTLEGIYNKDINPVVVTNVGLKPATETQKLSPNDERELYTGYWNPGITPYLLENGGNQAYYYSVSAQLRKSFAFGLDLSFAYTHSVAKSYNDGLGDQVTSSWTTNTYCVNGTNSHDIGYGSYVAPDRIIASIGYRKEYAKHFASSVSILYEGAQMGYAGRYGYNRYSYTYSNNVTGDKGANSLMYIPASKDELIFADVKDKQGKVTYSKEDQANDFWNYVEQDKYLKKHKGGYAERNAAYMPWRHQFDFKFMQDFYITNKGKRNTLQFGVDIINVGNLLNSKWGLFKQTNTNAETPLKYNGDGTFTMNMNGSQKLTETFTHYNNFGSTYSVQFSIRWIFN